MDVVLDLIEVRPKGKLDGHVLRMRKPSVRLYIAQRRGTLENVDLYEEVLDAIAEHDFDRDPDRLPPLYIVEIGNAWMDAVRESALPPVSGAS
jgi:hypothetical protein